MARIFDVLTENLTGNDSSDQTYGKDRYSRKKPNLSIEGTTHHTAIKPLLSASSLSTLQRQIDLKAIAPTQLGVMMAIIGSKVVKAMISSKAAQVMMSLVVLVVMMFTQAGQVMIHLSSVSVRIMRKSSLISPKVKM